MDPCVTDHCTDSLLNSLCRGKPENSVWWIFELLCHQTFALSRIPDHAIVATAVGLAKKVGLHRQAGNDQRSWSKNNCSRARASSTTRGSRGLGAAPANSSVLWPNDLATRHHLPVSLCQEHKERSDGLRWLNHVPPLCLRKRKGHWNIDDAHCLRVEGQWAWFFDPGHALKTYVESQEAVVQDYASEGL